MTQPTNREVAQQARRNRERSLGQQQPTNTELAQRQRRNQEHSLNQQQVPIPIALRPLSPQPAGRPSLRHRLGRCDVLCSYCGANHWVEERVQGSAKSAPRFSTCCNSGAIAMDAFQDPPQPLHSLLMDVTPSMFPHEVFADNYQWPQNFVETFGIITMPLHSVPLVSNRTCLFMALRAYMRSAFRANCAISLDPSFHCLGISQHSHRSTSMTQTRCNRHNTGCHIIMICSM